MTTTETGYARTDDPETSKAAVPPKIRRTSQKARLLHAYAFADEHGIDPQGIQPPRALEEPRTRGLTNHEAGVLSGLVTLPGCCYWHRCGDLLRDGMIEVMLYAPVTRPDGSVYRPTVVRASDAGESQRVCRITERGREVVRAWES